MIAPPLAVRWMPACRPPGSSAIRSPAPTRACGPHMRPAASAMWWWPPATTEWWPALAAGAPKPPRPVSWPPSLLDATPVSLASLVWGRRAPLDHPGALPARQGRLRPGRASGPLRDPAPSALIGLACNQVQHLFAALVAGPAGDLGHRLRWPDGRRRHQARAHPPPATGRPPHEAHDHGAGD
jgi:hypothetical protein